MVYEEIKETTKQHMGKFCCIGISIQPAVTFSVKVINHDYQENNSVHERDTRYLSVSLLLLVYDLFCFFIFLFLLQGWLYFTSKLWSITTWMVVLTVFVVCTSVVSIFTY